MNGGRGRRRKETSRSWREGITCALVWKLRIAERIERRRKDENRKLN